MKTKYVCHNLLSTYVNFHYNRTIRANILLVKFNSRGGGLEKEPLFFFSNPRLDFNFEKLLKHCNNAEKTKNNNC